VQMPADWQTEITVLSCEIDKSCGPFKLETTLFGASSFDRLEPPDDPLVLHPEAPNYLETYSPF